MWDFETDAEYQAKLDWADKFVREEIERIKLLRRAADRLRAMRLRRGAVELNLPETKIILDQDDPSRIRDIVPSRSSPAVASAYNLIEELMLAANEANGDIAVAHKLPMVFRVHDLPDADKLQLLAGAAEALRWAHMLKPGGIALVNQGRFVPPVVTIGLYDYPEDPIGEMRKLQLLYPEDLSQLDDATCQRLRELYWRLVRERADLGRHDREAAALIPRARRLHGRRVGLEARGWRPRRGRRPAPPRARTPRSRACSRRRSR